MFAKKDEKKHTEKQGKHEAETETKKLSVKLLNHICKNH